MKKKGLLISTIVMVVVLVASLTTATYAWFSATATVAIDSMSIKTEATNGLVIGAKTAAGDAYTNYAYDSLTWTNGNSYWTGGTEGLGSSVTFAGSNGTFGMTVDKACTMAGKSGKTYYEPSGSIFYRSGTSGFVKANAQEGNSKAVNSGSVEDAIMNKDYIDLQIGIAASSPKSVKQAWCTITITPEMNGEKLAMAASIHMTVKVNGNALFTNKDIYNSNVVNSSTDITNGNFGTVIKTANQSGYPNSTVGQLIIAFQVWKAADGASGDDIYMPVQETDVQDVEIIVWYEGTDNDCTNANTGYGNATMDIKFDYAGLKQNTQMYTFSGNVKTAA